MTPTSEVIRLAKLAGFQSGWTGAIEEFKRLISLAKAEEREAILQIVQKTCTPDATMRGDGYNQAAVEIEALIIARTKEAP